MSVQGADIFTKAVVQQKKIPFEISADPFYSATNQEHLKKAISELNSGKGKVHDLIEDDNENSLE